MRERLPKNKPMSFDNMVDGLITERKEKPKIYKQASDEHRKNELSNLAGRVASEMSGVAIREKISLVNLDEVKKQTILYIRANEAAGTIPTFGGLARSLGYTRQGLNKHIDKYTDTDTANWLQMVKDAFSDALGEAALTNQVNGIYAIFTQKAIFGMRESIELIGRQADDNNDQILNVEDIRARLLSTIDSD